MGRAERRAAARRNAPPRRVKRDRMLRARLMTSELLGSFPAAAYNTKANIESAMQTTRTHLISELGERRRSEVTWLVYDHDDIPDAIEEWHYEDEHYDPLREWIAANPGCVLVVAFAEATPLEPESAEPAEASADDG